MILPTWIRLVGCRTLFLGLVLASAAAAHANDSSRGVPLPGLQAEPADSLDASAATFDLQDGKINLSITLRRSGATAVNPAVVIRGPRFGWLGEAEPYPDRQFPELKAAFDGEALPPAMDFAVFAGEQDVTAAIRDAGLDPFAITDTPPFVDLPQGRGRTAFDHLLAAHAVQRSDGQFLAKWTAQRLFRFDTAGRTRTVLSLSFRARPGFSLVTLRDLTRAVRLESYCVTAESLSGQLGRSAADRRFVVKTYEIVLGVDGKPPERAMARASGQGTFFCKPDGTAAFGGPHAASSPARVDSRGVLQVLELSAPD
jgi:hypothetical protein